LAANIDISADNTLLASGSFDETARIWNLDTGKLVAGLFKSEELVSAVRFSPDSKKLAVLSWTSKSLEVWDVQSQRFKFGGLPSTYSPVFWTKNKNSRNALISFTTKDSDDITTIYEVDSDALTLKLKLQRLLELPSKGTPTV
jgi:WD40 repeat protein